MRLAIFGATGTVGRELLAQALAADHQVRALARTPAKLPGSDGRLSVVPGDVNDPAAVRHTLNGCDAVLGTLGARGKDAPYTRRTGTATIIAAMHEHGIRRLVVMGGFHLHFPCDPENLGQKLILPILRLSPNLAEDTTGMAALLRAASSTGRWCAHRAWYTTPTAAPTAPARLSWAPGARSRRARRRLHAAMPRRRQPRPASTHGQPLIPTTTRGIR